MSGLLYGVGAIAVVAGVVMIGFGIPVNEFSFGNTLIGAGTTAVVGGLIVIGLGVVVAQLQRIAEALATRAPIRPSRPLDMFEPQPARALPRLQAEFRSRPGRNRRPALREPHPEPAGACADGRAATADPSRRRLRNPDEPPVDGRRRGFAVAAASDAPPRRWQLRGAAAVSAAIWRQWIRHGRERA